MGRLKVLFYNWTDLDDAEQRGGGVSVYQKNLIDAAVRNGDDVWFISSGTAYSPISRKPFIRKVSRKGPVHVFELVNSPIMSPGHFAFAQDVTAEPDMETLFAEFLSRHGSFDVVHFNNLEGIPVSFLRLARVHASAAKVVYSIHNYFAFCPQVNLWFQEKASCKDFRDGRKCVNCLVVKPASNGLRWRYQMEYCLRRLGVPPRSIAGRAVRSLSFGLARLLYRSVKAGMQAVSGNNLPGSVPPGRAPTGQPLGLLDPVTAAGFAARRRSFVTALNTYADHILAVSERVAEIAVGYGVNRSKVTTLYIGTKFAKQVAVDCRGGDRDSSGLRNNQNERVLRVLYPGYMRRDKGFYFYLDALKRMPSRLAARLQLVFATKIGDPLAYERIRSMAHRFDAVTVYNGYTHAQLPHILAGIDLGVVPVLWEDNLPQVAIECVASGVPILTSDRGGARELLDCPALVFKAGSFADFFNRIEAILGDPDLPRAALARRRPLFTPEEHYQRLHCEIYQGATPPTHDARKPRDHVLTATARLCDTSSG
jgi:glycosyltransferase involved in cell wall biosynthesis